MTLVSLPIGDEVARLPQEWFLNTPVLWLGALVLIGLVRGPLRTAPALLKKPLRFAAASCLALGSVILLMWNPVLQTARQNKPLGPFWILLLGITSIGWIVSFFRIFLARPQRRTGAAPVAIGSPLQRPAPKPVEAIRNVPAERFADLGGMEEAKEQIRQVVQGHLNPEKYERYGLVRNGILLYGPRGTGKTFFARATAGEFGLNFEYVSAPKLLTRWIGATGENIQGVFAQAAARKPVLFFIDEIDSLGGGRQDAISDPGGAGREFNNITMALMSAIDQYRTISGFVLMAATNRLDGLDEALIREGRFDVRVRIDLPDEATRVKILEAQLSKKPWKRFDLQEFARQTPGASAAKLRALVDQAANYALTDNRKIEAKDLQRAMDGNGGKDRPQPRARGMERCHHRGVRRARPKVHHSPTRRPNANSFFGTADPDRAVVDRSARDRKDLDCNPDRKPNQAQLLSADRCQRSRRRRRRFGQACGRGFRARQGTQPRNHLPR